MTNFTTELMETLLKKGDLDDLFCRHLEHAINSLLQAELTAFLDYEKYDRAGFDSGHSRHGNYSRSFKALFCIFNFAFLIRSFLLIKEYFRYKAFVALISVSS